MRNLSKRAGSLLWKLLYWLLVLMLSLLVFILFLRISGIGTNDKATIEQVLTRTAHQPYVYRQLLPTAANLAAPFLDEAAALRFGRTHEAVVSPRFFRTQLNGRAYPREIILLLGMMYLSLAGFAATMWLFLRDLGYGLLVRYLMPPAMLAASTVFFGFGYEYDFTLLLLFTMGLWLMYRQAWAGYLVVLALGTLNKETTLFLILVFAINYWNRLGRRPFLILGITQFAVYGLIQGFLRYQFRNNPGGAVEWHLPDQIAMLRYLVAHSPWLLAVWTVVVVAIILLVVHKWAHKAVFLRSALCMLPFFLVLFFLWAYPLEIRDLLEVFPVTAMLMLPPPPSSPPDVPR